MKNKAQTTTKIDLSTLLLAIMVIFAVGLLHLPEIVAKISTEYSYQTGLDSEIAKRYSYKQDENTFWNSVKGITFKATSSKYLIEQIEDEEKQKAEEENLSPKEIDVRYALTYPIDVLLIGDSMMLEGFGPELEAELLEYDGINVVRKGKYSSGLNKVDYFDWYAYSRELLDEYQPDVVIIMFGGNDGQPITGSDGRNYPMSSEDKWHEIYSKRVYDMMKQLSASAKRVYWVGQPIPKDSDFEYKFKVMDEIYAAESLKFYNVEFINSWDRFAIDGKYAPVLTNSAGIEGYVKYDDGVHLRPHGAAILSEMVIERLMEDVKQ